jgi:iron complex outermembrane recepter protein
LFEKNLKDLNIKYCTVILERIEVREAPQGTLFGSGAEAGVLRYIMNTPRLDVTAGARVFE